jgi:hypothetical protein
MRFQPRLGGSRSAFATSLVAFATLMSATSQAASPAVAGVSFGHRDWELACDNTRTCRAAGYQPEEAELAVSLLLTRAAGPGTPVQARLTLGDYGDEDQAASDPARGPGLLKLRVNGKALGTLPWLTEHDTFGLSPAQLQAVLKALPRPNARIEFSHGRHVWRLSDQGAAAVLLKMDEFQGRLGTPTALARPGNQPETQALPPLPTPVLRAAKLPPAAAPSARLQAAVRAELKKNEDADEEFRIDSEDGQLSFQPLGGGHWLVSKLCWRGAYNAGSCAWVVNERKPGQFEPVTDSASDIGEGEIWASQKSRGLGDCWHHQVWTWDGHHFVQTRDSSSGQCKLVTPGGAWDLPTLVTDVVKP